MTPAAISFRGVAKSFGAVRALEDLSLDVAPGTVLGLLGPNGAGKTTAVRIVATLTLPDAGSASILGVDVASQPDVVRQLIGVSGQNAAVDEHLTGAENLRLVGRLTHLGRDLASQRCDELIEQFDLVDAANRRVATYSGGMRRRLDLAAAIVHRPAVLILDEPTTGLDPPSRRGLWETIRALGDAGTTTLLTTQYLEEVDQLADQVVILDAGKVAARGTVSELKSKWGHSVIEVVVAKDKIDAARAALATVGSVEMLGDAQGLALAVSDVTRSLAAIVRALDTAGIEPETLNMRQPTLDDVFLNVTQLSSSLNGAES